MFFWIGSTFSLPPNNKKTSPSPPKKSSNLSHRSKNPPNKNSPGSQKVSCGTLWPTEAQRTWRFDGSPKTKGKFSHPKISQPILGGKFLTPPERAPVVHWKFPEFFSCIIIREEDAPSVGKYGKNNALEQPPQDRKHISWKTIVHFLSHRKASLTFLTNNFPYYPLPFI